MLPQDDLTTSEHFRDQRHNKHFALCYNKVMPFATFATDNWIFIWVALSKLSIIPWVRARERCLTVQLGKAGLGQTHAPSTPAIPLQEQKRECTGAWPFQWDQQDTDNLFLFYKQMYLFLLQYLFLPGEFKLSGESTQLTGGDMNRKSV